MPPYNRAVPVAPDLLVLEGMSFYGYHGETQAERTLGNRFHVDVELRMDLATAGRTDDIKDTLDYSRAFALVREVVEEQQYSLIEAIAARIAETLLAEPHVDSIRVRVGKQPPIAGAIERCSVIIERFATQTNAQAGVHE
jgi:dihydroneopterin aldolase